MALPRVLNFLFVYWGVAVWPELPRSTGASLAREFQGVAAGGRLRTVSIPLDGRAMGSLTLSRRVGNSPTSTFWQKALSAEGGHLRKWMPQDRSTRAQGDPNYRRLQEPGPGGASRDAPLPAALNYAFFTGFGSERAQTLPRLPRAEATPGEHNQNLLPVQKQPPAAALRSLPKSPGEFF